jgi:autotransporter-associated beta strand protein
VPAAGAAGQTLTLSGVISGGASLTKIGGSALTLQGANAYTGSTRIENGTVYCGSATTLPATRVDVMSSATLNLNGFNVGVGSLAGAGQVVLGAQTLTSGGDGTSSQFDGVISGTGGLTKAGAGIFTLRGTNTYTGATTVSAGTLTNAVNDVIADASAVTVVAGATWNLNNRTETVGSIAGAGSITLGSGTVTAGGDGTSTIFSGGVSGTGSLTKQGAGTLTLSGTDAYTGATTVNAGTLLVTGSTAAGSAVAVIGQQQHLGPRHGWHEHRHIEHGRGDDECLVNVFG